MSSILGNVPDYIYDLRSYKPPSDVKIYTREEIEKYIQEKIEKGENPFPDPEDIKKRKRIFIPKKQ